MQCVIQNMVKISVENLYGKYLCINTWFGPFFLFFYRLSCASLRELVSAIHWQMKDHKVAID